MELFKYRNVALGCAVFLVFLPISYYVAFSVRLTLLLAACTLAIGAILWHVLSHSSRSLSVLLKAIPALAFLALAMVVSMIFYNDDKATVYFDGSAHTAVMEITDVSYSENDYGIYEAELSSIDGQEQDFKILLYAAGTPLSRGDTVEATGVLTGLYSPTLGFDSSSYNLGKGITCKMESSQYSVLESNPSAFYDFLDSARNFLSSRLKKVGDEDTFAVLSALILGERENLGLEVRRDFTRIGLNHILALSGMHITIVVTLIGYALVGAPIKKSLKEAILICSTLLFVGMTGFSLSAVRAGVMVCLAYTLQFFGGRVSTVSCLFFSVTAICITSPYSIFSLSLILSFFAMLGCIASARIIKRYRLYRIFRKRVVRFAAFTFISSTFALLFTLPIVTLYFGSFSLVSPISNIIVAPLFSFLIYLAPIFLIFADVPILSAAIGSICTGVCNFAVSFGGLLSSIDGILIPIMNAVQYVAVILIFAFLFLALAVARRHLLRALCGVLAGALVFTVGTLILFIERWNNVYVGVYAENESDVVFIEDEGEFILFDMTRASGTKYSLPYYVSHYLGYFEIDVYVITDYYSKTVTQFDNLTGATVVKAVRLPTPQNAEEEELRSRICDVAARKGVLVLEDTGDFASENTSVTFSPVSDIGRSEMSSIVFNVDCGSARFTYVGKSGNDLPTYFVENSLYTADVAVFGSHGPALDSQYHFAMPYIDYAVFLYDETELKKDEFREKYKSLAPQKDDLPIRFLLTP